MQSAPAHVYADLFSLLAETAALPNPKDLLASLPLEHQVAALQGARLNPAPWCCRHEQACPCPVPDLDCTGTPCQDFSPVGSRKGPHGPQMCVFLAWCRVVILRAVPMLLHENVPAFWVSLLEEHLGSAYIIYSFVVDCRDLGFQLINRRRRYTILYHRSKVRVVWDPFRMYSLLSARLLLHGGTRVQDCCLADMHELVEEVREQAARRRVPLERIFDFACMRPVGMRLLLSNGECQRLRHYSRQWQLRFHQDARDCPWAVFNLADNPGSGRFTWSAASQAIPGLRTNAGKLWMPALGRWLTCKELLAAMGLPVYPVLAHAAGVPLVEVRPGREARHMLGNMMHAATCGVLQLVALACAAPAPAPA